MNLSNDEAAVLKALFRCSREGLPLSPVIVAAVAGLPARRFTAAADAVAARLLIDRTRLTLSWSGLAVASRLIRPRRRSYAAEAA
jgi:hypothetical protein